MRFLGGVFIRCFPGLLKFARVVSIFKGGFPNDLINYTPISTLPTLSKMFERSMYMYCPSSINFN